MITIKTYTDFLQLIDDGPDNGYLVYFENSSIANPSWTVEHYLEYLGNIEHHKHETGIITRYEFLCDDNNRVLKVNVILHFPEYKGAPEKNATINWVVC